MHDYIFFYIFGSYFQIVKCQIVFCRKKHCKNLAYFLLFSYPGERPSEPIQGQEGDLANWISLGNERGNKEETINYSWKKVLLNFMCSE